MIRFQAFWLQIFNICFRPMLALYSILHLTLLVGCMIFFPHQLLLLLSAIERDEFVTFCSPINFVPKHLVQPGHVLFLFFLIYENTISVCSGSKKHWSVNSKDIKVLFHRKSWINNAIKLTHIVKVNLK